MTSSADGELPDIDSLPTTASDRTPNAFLIGLSQHGKSTLANFLFYNDVHFKKPSRFAMGKGPFSCTSKLQSENVDHVYVFVDQEMKKGKVLKDHIKKQQFTIKVTDTPGLNDTMQREEHNLLGICSELNSWKEKNIEMNCIFLVVKIDRSIDDAFKKNLIFYKKLFSDLFISGNVVLVITNAKGTTDWFESFRPEDDPKVSMQEIKRAILDVVNLTDIPMVYLDADPRTPGELAHAQGVRKYLLDRCCSLQGVSLKNLRFPKLPKWIQEDNVIISGLQGTIMGKSESTKFFEENFKANAEDIAKGTNKIAQQSQVRNNFQKELDEKNTEALVQIFSKNYSDSWHFFSRPNESINIKTDYPIVTWKATDGAWLDLEVDEPQHKRGQIKAGYLSNMNASLTMFTSSKFYHAKRITTLITNLENTNAKIHELESDLSHIRGENEKLDGQIKKYTQELLELDLEVQRLSLDYYTLKEFASRSNKDASTSN